MSTDWEKPVEWSEVENVPKVKSKDSSYWVFMDEVAVIFRKSEDILNLAKKLGFKNPKLEGEGNILVSSYHVIDDETRRDLYGHWWKTLTKEEKYVHLIIEVQ